MFCKHFIKKFTGVSSFNGASRVGGCEVRGSTQYIPHKKYELFYSEHTVYFPDPLCCARSMAELCSIQKALHKGELFGVAYFLVILLGFICFAACFCKLVTAGCILKSTFNSTDFFLYLGYCESFNELWDSLKISVTAPCKLYVMYYISIEVKLNLC